MIFMIEILMDNIKIIVILGISIITVLIFLKISGILQIWLEDWSFMRVPTNFDNPSYGNQARTNEFLRNHKIKEKIL
jgi:hypothetical protein